MNLYKNYKINNLYLVHMNELTLKCLTVYSAPCNVGSGNPVLSFYAILTQQKSLM